MGKPTERRHDLLPGMPRPAFGGVLLTPGFKSRRRHEGIQQGFFDAMQDEQQPMLQGIQEGELDPPAGGKEG